MDNTQLSFTEAITQSGFETIDFIIWLAYIVLLVSLGMFLSRAKDGREKSVSDYFLAGNTLTWWAVGASLIAANISAEHFIGMSGAGYSYGIAIAAYELIAAIVLIIIGKFLLPSMVGHKLFTVPQFLRERYNDGVGLAFSILWLFLYVFVNLTAVAWLGALAIEQILGLQGMNIIIGDFDISARMLILTFLFVVSGLYSINGGQTSVAWTDVMQVTFIVGGGFITAYFAFNAIAGDDGTAVDGIKKLYVYLTTGDYVNDTHLHLVVQNSRNSEAFNEVPGIGAIVGGVWLANFGYWGANQFLAQKTFSSINLKEARKGIMFAATLKIFLPIIIITPGLCAFYMVNHLDGSAHIQSTMQTAEDAYPWFVSNFAPTGVKGLTFVALTAAVISSLASLCNSTSTIFTMDIYKKYINHAATDKELVNIGRLTALLSLIVAILAVRPLLVGRTQAFTYIQEFSGFIYPGLITVFALGLFWKRATTTAAAWTATITLPLSILFKLWMPNVAFQFRACYVFIIVLLCFVLISCLSQKNVPCKRPGKKSRKGMLLWGFILGSIGLLILVAALIVSVWYLLLPDDATPSNNIIAYLQDIGFKSFYFFGILISAAAMFLLSNALDKRKDPKAQPFNLGRFSTPKSYTYGALAICTITTLYYILFW